MLANSRLPFVRSALLGACLFFAVGLHSCLAEVRNVGLTAQLFLDDHIVERIKDLKRELHRPEKKGLIQEADGKPWDRGFWPNVVRDPTGGFHLFYLYLWQDPSVRNAYPAIGDDKAHWVRHGQAYAVSKDGIRWTKPVLGLAEGPTGLKHVLKEKGILEEPTGFSRKNNLGCPISGIVDLHEFGGVSNPRRRYLVGVEYRDDTHPFAKITDAGLYYAADVPDVVNDPRWRKRLEVIWEGPRPTTARGQGLHVAFDERQKVWFECGQCSFPNIIKADGRYIARWVSRDLQTWGAEEPVLPVAADESRRPEDRVEYMIIQTMRVSDFWLGRVIVFHGDRTSPQFQMPGQPRVWRKGRIEMRLVMSRDAGKTWQRVGGQEAWIPHHEDPDGYDRSIFTSSPVRVGDELWIYYGCWDGDHITWNRDGTPYYKDRYRTAGRIARAVLRWDGYVSLRPKAEAGEVLTKPIATAGRRLVVNAAASMGSVRVEVQDAEGKAVPGFALADSGKLTGDDIAQPLRWGDKTELPAALQGKPLRLRFDVRQADLYGFQFVADKP